VGFITDLFTAQVT